MSIRQPGAGRRPFILEGCASDAVLFPSGASHISILEMGIRRTHHNTRGRGGGLSKPTKLMILWFQITSDNKNSLPQKEEGSTFTVAFC